MGFLLSEHKSVYIYNLDENKELNPEYPIFSNLQSKVFNTNGNCFSVVKTDSSIEIKADYYIGIDWLGDTGRHIFVEPKINQSTIETFKASIEFEENTEIINTDDSQEVLELDFLKMLLEISSNLPDINEVRKLVQIDWNAEQIEIEQINDRLTPFIIVHFIQLLKRIVKKGLKKKYYKVQSNLQNRIKGKILVGQQIKQNVLKNRFTTTFCEYEVFGIDHKENQFLKKVLQYAISYVENNKIFFGNSIDQILNDINYCRPAFEFISDNLRDNHIHLIKNNPFYTEYPEAIQVGTHILKRFAYNISKTSEEIVKTPPFWIDMPSLFELYVYNKMLKANLEDYNKIHFQFSTLGNALDILVSHPEHQMIIDTKYKLHYKLGHLHQDIRQVSGYPRLNKVRDKLNVSSTDDKNIDCLIIYPDIDKGIEDFSLQNIQDKKEAIKAYHKVYKLGVKIPVIDKCTT